MKRKNVTFIFRGLLFLLIGVLLFQIISGVFLEKNSYAKYRNFLKQEDIDVLILGSSHSDNGIAPEIIEKYYKDEQQSDISVFNYSIYGMRMEQMYYFMKDALKVHVPKVVVIETFAFVPLADEHREILARRAFDMLPLTLNKIEAIQYCVKEDHWSYYIPFIKYHTRWKELNQKDFSMLYNEDAWGSAGERCHYNKEVMEEQDDYFKADTREMKELREITDTETECLEKLLDLAEENHISILFTSVPFKEQLGMTSLEMIKINNYLQKFYVNDENIQLLDMNRMWDELDFGYKDLYNEGHCNKKGALKVTNCLYGYLNEHYDLGVSKGRGENNDI